MMDGHLGLALGLDNALVALALGPLNLGTRRMALLGLCFAAAEVLMTLAGTAVGAIAPIGLFAGSTRAGLLATLAVAVAALALLRRDPTAWIGNPAGMFGLAILLSLDNLLAGTSLSLSGSSFAAVCGAGALSGLLAFAACAAGNLPARALTPVWRPFATAGALAAIAAAGMA
jgi:putative Mn2+ efflux pump MntP